MMDSYTESEEDQFFDSRDEITSVSDWDSHNSEEPTSGLVNCVPNGFGYGFWTQNPESVGERRSRLLKWMGLSEDCNPTERDESGDTPCDEFRMDIDRIRENSGAVLANSGFDDRCMPSGSFVSCLSNEALGLVEDNALEDNSVCKIRNLDDGTEFVVDELGQDGMLIRLREVGSNRMVSFEEFESTVGSSSLVRQFLRREAEVDNMVHTKKKVKRGWLQKLSIMAHTEDRDEGAGLKPCGISLKVEASVRRVQVHSYKKRSKELSSLHIGQEIPAHTGSILTMKFSPDGQYLATAGEDGIVRVWKVTEDERPTRLDIQDADPSCLYFSLSQFSKLAPLNEHTVKIGKMKRLRKSAELPCVILPPKVFGIFEKPLQEYHGHCCEVLALSWSKKGYLLSSSADKTVRLWQLGHDQCLRVFSHNNYVTSVEFNPVDDNYFISGSIDGKVRIWEVHGCQVVDWTDIREIVTAVCYCPNGKGGIVGSMDGNCIFYDIIDNCLQLGSQICLHGKKKLPGKRITGFQFCPNDLTKVIVTSADSQVRVLSGANVICKFKGNQNSGSQASASFTSDGKHIVSATEDSNICMWNYLSQDRISSKAKKIKSCESFLSHNASIAIPWCGMSIVSRTSSGDDLPGCVLANQRFGEDLHRKMPLSSPDCFSLSRGFLLEALHKGSATWPEEKLPNSSPLAISPSFYKSGYKFLKSAYQSTFSSPHLWGLVVVTAGWDGRIRTYLNYGLPMRL
ncbi:unnamed protein product [Ilex paraguariensis]|uniref:Uncharacterized protein n=1 Tax=Ilex paraguariensis TaxID=185542 RepID=A0ABC8TK53_9AQUA